MKAIETTTRTPPSPDAVWALSADVSAWGRWGEWSKVAERGASTALAPDAFVCGLPFAFESASPTGCLRERMAHELLDGMGFSGYSSDVSLFEPAAGGAPW